MSNITDRVPRRIPEWLSLQDIARAWSEETGEDAAAFEAGFRVWFKDYLLRNAYGEEGADGADAGIPAQLLEGRQIWRETFETFCEERGLAKPRFWFAGDGQASAALQPMPIPEAGAAEPGAEVPEPPNQDDKAPSRRRVREGSTSFIWIAAGLVVAVVAGLVTLWLRDMDLPGIDAGLLSGPVEEIQMSRVVPAEPDPGPTPAGAPAQVTPPEPAPSKPDVAAASAPAPALPASEAAAPEVNSDPATTPAPTTISDPAAAQIATAPLIARRIEPTSAATLPEVPVAGQAVAGEPVDQGLVLLLQRELQAAGYDPGPLDGTPGTRFAAAIVSYQRANSLHADGRASIELLSHLARENLKAGRMAPLAPMVAPGGAPGVAPAVAPKTGQAAAGSQTAARDSRATPQTSASVRVPAPRGRELVRAIQKRLSDRGYYSGPLDGSLGPKTREAIQTYQRVQRYDATGQPSRAIYEELEDYALDVRGLDQFQRGAYDAAIATYTRIIQRKPKNADAYFNRGLAYKNDGRVEQALSDYEAAIELDPAHRKAYFDRANILYDQGHYRDALRAYFNALKLMLKIG
jgi:peptidoglycan hydrolase-like protein with peptidoglycan-binding domain